MTKTDLLCQVLRSSGMLRLKGALASRRRGRNLLILAYHRVLENIPDKFPFDRDVVSCSRTEFKKEMEFVAKYFDVISFADLASGKAERVANPLIVTFDDGYRDNAEVALPVLKSVGVGATFFVTTSYIDHDDIPWWDAITYAVNCFEGDALPLEEWMGGSVSVSKSADRTEAVGRVLRRAKQVSDAERRALLMRLRECSPRPDTGLADELMMSWAHCRQLVSEGMELGSHTVSHPVLSRVEDAEAIAEELSASKTRIEAQAGCRVNAISYPVGSRNAISDSVVAAIKHAGYCYACLYEHGINVREQYDPFRLLRIKTEVGSDFSRFRSKVLFPGIVRY